MTQTTTTKESGDEDEYRRGVHCGLGGVIIDNAFCRLKSGTSMLADLHDHDTLAITSSRLYSQTTPRYLVHGGHVGNGRSKLEE